MQTIFNRNEIPSNLLEPMDWLKFANRAFSKPVSIQTAMKRFAEQKGGDLFLGWPAEVGGWINIYG